MGIFFGKIFRAILMFLDDAVYGLSELVYRLFIRIAETGIFSQASIQEFAGRIYFFLGLAMLFKVSISIIDYIMNPDSVKDNKVGASKLLKNIITILVGIVAIPYVFEAAYGLQRIILKDNVIGNLILGVKYTDADEAESFTHRAGDEMSFTVYNAFFHINEDLGLPEGCQNGAWEDAEGNFKDKCFPTGESSSDLNAVKDKYIAAYNAKERKELTKFDIMNATVKYNGDDEFVFSYMYVVATAAGAFLCYILLLFCFDIAIRSVKLGFLQLIAPIPLISKIDPKKGDEVFSKWVKEVTSTYLVLFLRLVAIYFAIYIISSLTDSYNVVTGEDERNLFVNVFMIFGVLLFVKDLPKLVETLTGVKISGSLNIAKRFGEVPIVGNAVGNTTRKTLAGIDAKRNGHTFRSGWNKAKDSDKGMFADMRKKLDSALPYSAQTRKKAFESREKAEEQAEMLKVGAKYGDAVNKAKADVKKNSGLTGWNLTKAQNQAAGETLFGKGSEMAKRYAEMMNAKSAKDTAGSMLTEAKANLDAGKSYNGKSGEDLAKYISELEVNSLKAQGAYSAAESQFVKEVNNDAKAKEAYEAFNTYTDQQKFSETGAEKIDNYAQGYTDSYSGAQPPMGMDDYVDYLQGGNNPQQGGGNPYDDRFGA